MKYLVILAVLVSFGHLTLGHANSIEGSFIGHGSMSGELYYNEKGEVFGLDEQAEVQRVESCHMACGQCDPNHEGRCVITARKDTLGMSGYLAAPADFYCYAMPKDKLASGISSLSECN